MKKKKMEALKSELQETQQANRQLVAERQTLREHLREYRVLETRLVKLVSVLEQKDKVLWRALRENRRAKPRVSTKPKLLHTLFEQKQALVRAVQTQPSTKRLLKHYFPSSKTMSECIRKNELGPLTSGLFSFVLDLLRQDTQPSSMKTSQFEKPLTHAAEFMVSTISEQTRKLIQLNRRLCMTVP